MNELVTQTCLFLGQLAELLKIPVISGAATSLFGWLKSKFTGNSAQEKLALIEQNKHNESTIIILQGNIESALENNAELQKQLAEKLKEMEKLMKDSGVQPANSSSISINGDNNITSQNIINSKISIKPVRQTHSGSGDIVHGNKIVGR